MKKDKGLHILMTGGGTLGPVTPLLNLYDIWSSRDEEVRFSWIGTFIGPERELVERKGIDFWRITSPKLSRGRKWKWIFIPFHFLVSVLMSFYVLRNLKPDLMITTGGYVSVPIAFVCKLMGIPVWVHQLDAKVGLANKIMAPLAVRVSTTFEESVDNFSPDKTVFIGALLNDFYIEQVEAKNKLGIKKDKPLLLVLGGGTGAVQINEMMLAIAEDLLDEWQIVHITGPGKMIPELQDLGGDYMVDELVIDEMPVLFAAADLVICRAGLGTLLDLIKWGKPSIAIPISGSQQEKNMELMLDYNVARGLNMVNAQILLETIRSLADSRLEREAMSQNVFNMIPHDGSIRLIEEVESLLNYKNP